MCLSAGSLDSARCKNQRVVGVRGLVDDQVWEILGFGGDGCEFRSCGGGSSLGSMCGVGTNKVVGGVGGVIFGLWAKLQGKAGLGRWGND
jgi:hypothetical protein